MAMAQLAMKWVMFVAVAAVSVAAVKKGGAATPLHIAGKDGEQWDLVDPEGVDKKLPFEAVFQGLCEDSSLCAQTCFNLHDGTFECNCHYGWHLDGNGYSCSVANDSSREPSLLYRQETSVVARLELGAPGDTFPQDYLLDYPKEYVPTYNSNYATNFAKTGKKAHKPQLQRPYKEPVDAEGEGALRQTKAGKMQDGHMEGRGHGQKPFQEEDNSMEEPRVLPYMDDLRRGTTSGLARSASEPIGGPYSSQTLQGPTLDQKVPSRPPKLASTENIVASQCMLDCGAGRCYLNELTQASCRCPMGTRPPLCEPAPRFDVARFHGKSWVAFAPLKEAYTDVQLTIEFKPDLETQIVKVHKPRFDLNMAHKRMQAKRKRRSTDGFDASDDDDDDAYDYHYISNEIPLGYDEQEHRSQMEDEDFYGRTTSPYAETVTTSRPTNASDRATEQRLRTYDAIMLVSGESDDLTGDFMAVVVVSGELEFRWDCGSGAGMVRGGAVRAGWNTLTVHRHRWGVWLDLNSGGRVYGRSQGLFSRMTFRDPLYVGGSFNLTSLRRRLGVSQGFRGCVRRLQVNDHVYRFYRKSDNDTYGAYSGWDVTECTDAICSELACENGGQCKPHGRQDDRPVCSCPVGYEGRRCGTKLNLQIPSFNGSAYLQHRALGGAALHWLELELILQPSAEDGLILYSGPETPDDEEGSLTSDISSSGTTPSFKRRKKYSSDLIALSLEDAHVVFTIDLGSGPVILRSPQPTRPGVWHRVRVSRTGRSVWLTVDDQPAVEARTPGGFSLLLLVRPLFLGGLPQGRHVKGVPGALRGFQGCMQKLSFGDRPTSLVSGAVGGRGVGACVHPCSDAPCLNGGRCLPQGAGYECSCPEGYGAPNCRTLVLTEASTPSFGGRSFLKFTSPEIMKRVTGDKLHMWFRFRSTAPDGLLLWIGDDIYTSNPPQPPSPGDCLGLWLLDGRLLLRYNLGAGEAVLRYNDTALLHDGDWHTVRLARFERQAQLTVDDGPELITFSPGDLVQLNVGSGLFVGGREHPSPYSAVAPPGLTGCVTDLTLATDYHVDLVTMATAGQNIEYC